MVEIRKKILVEGIVMNEEYITKTREAVNFLTRIYSEDMITVASILSSQAEGRTEYLIAFLELVQRYIEELIEELKNISIKG